MLTGYSWWRDVTSERGVGSTSTVYCLASHRRKLIASNRKGIVECLVEFDTSVKVFEKRSSRGSHTWTGDDKGQRNERGYHDGVMRGSCTLYVMIHRCDGPVGANASEGQSE